MKDKKFPLVVEHMGENDGVFTVCFINETGGTVVKSKNKKRHIGYFSERWKSCFDECEWQIIAQPSEYPKEMFVSDNSEEHAALGKLKRVVFAEKNGKFYAWSYAQSIEIAENEKDVTIWQYAVDIPEVPEKELCDWTPDDVNKMTELPPDHIPVPKPPIGLTPRHIVQDNRMREILAAMERYALAEQMIPIEWINEYNELVEIKKNRKQ